MAKPQRKALARLQVRQRSYDSLSVDKQRSRTRPGSHKKSQPLGKKR